MLVGVLNTGFGYLIYSTGILLHLHHGIALCISTSLGIIFNFITTGTLVFGNRSLRPILMYLLVQLALFGVNFSLLNALCKAGLNPFLAQALCLPIIMLLGFILIKSFVFRR